MTFFWIILALSFPVFYIYGIFAFFRDLGKKEDKKPRPGTDSNQLLTGIIHELNSKAEETPNKTIKELLEEYKKRSAAMYTSPSENVLFRQDTPPSVSVYQTHKEETKPDEDFLTTWYSNNSINLLLYKS